MNLVTTARNSSPPSVITNAIGTGSAIGVPGIDEALTDGTLKTKWDRHLGGVYRRIKHFSGYNVYSGRSAAY